MEIAPGIQHNEWLRLNLNDLSSPDWNQAIEILKMRIENRYFEPVDLLIEKETHKMANERKYGFTILSIDCLLIETLQAFIEGWKTTKNKSEKAFKKFLTTSPSFKKHFSQEMAIQFYKNYRCGILHQAEIQSDSLVWSIGPIVQNINNKMVINRTEFHKKLKDDFYHYLEQLKDERNVNLRNNFQKKMNHICQKRD